MPRPFVPARPVGLPRTARNGARAAARRLICAAAASSPKSAECVLKVELTGSQALITLHCANRTGWCPVDWGGIFVGVWGSNHWMLPSLVHSD